MWKIPSGDCKTFPGHGERNECGKLLADGKDDNKKSLQFPISHNQVDLLQAGELSSDIRTDLLRCLI